MSSEKKNKMSPENFFNMPKAGYLIVIERLDHVRAEQLRHTQLTQDAEHVSERVQKMIGFGNGRMKGQASQRKVGKERIARE